MKAPDKIPFPLKAPLKKAGRPKGSTNKTTPKFPIKVSDMDKLKNLIGRQDDLIAQLQDNLKDLERQVEEKTQEIDLLEGRIDNYREILKTLLEITE